MKERIVKMYDVLKDTGSFYLHCDWHAGHYLKVMLDNIFGYKYFQNEIVWYYRGGGVSKERFGRKHDTIFFYTKGDKWTFDLDEVRTSYSEEILSRPKSSYRHHHYGDKDAPTAVVNGWDLNPKGKCPDDVFQIPIINPCAAERLGYPTQKPEALLEIIIKASSKKEAIVLDPFCGCGTAMAVAQRLERKWIGIDISPTAIKLIEKRLEKVGAIKNKDFETIGMPTTLSELRALEPFEFQNWVINEMRAKQSKKLSSDFGLDGYYDKTIFTEKAGIQVKQSEGVGRNVVDNFETALSRGKFTKGFIVALSFSKGANEEAARAKGEGLEIRLIKVEDLLLGKVKI
jgi:DNA modification methylase